MINCSIITMLGHENESESESREIVDCSKSADESSTYTCHQNRSQLGPCDGLADPDFGYASGQPCILLKLNKVQPQSVN